MTIAQNKTYHRQLTHRLDSIDATTNGCADKRIPAIIFHHKRWNLRH